MSKDDPVNDLHLVKVELDRISEFADDAINRLEVLRMVNSQFQEA
jgi:hypothetical protein